MPDAAVVEQAKGVLMLRYGIGSYEALAVLDRWSRESGFSLREVSRGLTHGVCQGYNGHTAYEQGLVRWLEQRLREDPTAPDSSKVVSLRG